MRQGHPPRVKMMTKKWRLVPKLGTRGFATLKFDTDPGMVYERAAVLGHNGEDPTSFYPYGLAVQPQMWLVGLTPKRVYCNNNENLRKLDRFSF